LHLQKEDVCIDLDLDGYGIDNADPKPKPGGRVLPDLKNKARMHSKATSSGANSFKDYMFRK
jgi:hypothetical protein